MSGPFDLFSHTVPEAHEKFVAACHAAGATPEAVVHPRTGPNGEALHSVVARLGAARAANVLLVISGTHGIEGYFGAAMQVDALARRGELLAIPDDTAIVFVHLVNPWGTAWSSRENEDVIELLRGHYACHHPWPPNPIFTDFHETMGYARIRSLDEFLEGRAKAFTLVERHGLEALMQAIGAGQREHPDAITYVGRGPTWSKHLLDSVATEHVAGARKLLVLDLHTAVGPRNETVVFHPYAPGTALAAQAEAHLGPCWPNPELLDFYDWFADLCPGTEVRTVICEAGTEELGPADQFIFPLDVWLKTYGDRSDPAAAPHLERYRRFFYPETEEWMHAVHASFVARWPSFLGFLAAPWEPLEHSNPPEGAPQ